MYGAPQAINNMTRKASYPSDMTDAQWDEIKEMIPPARTKPRKYDVREALNGIFYLVREGCSWRAIPVDFPSWTVCRYYFEAWTKAGLWERIHHVKSQKLRESVGRDADPSAIIIDSQSVKITQFTFEEKGIDGGKLINGRKRTILVDTLGLPWSIKVTAANISDNQAGILAVDLLQSKVPRLEKITADMGYKNTFLEHINSKYGWEVEIAQKPESIKGFIPQKNRWQVERSFGWLNFRRRLFRDVEKTILSAEAMLQIAFISFIINRL